MSTGWWQDGWGDSPGHDDRRFKFRFGGRWLFVADVSMDADRRQWVAAEWQVNGRYDMPWSDGDWRHVDWRDVDRGDTDRDRRPPLKPMLWQKVT